MPRPSCWIVVIDGVGAKGLSTLNILVLLKIFGLELCFDVAWVRFFHCRPCLWQQG